MIETIVKVLEALCLGLGCFLLGMAVQERVSRSGPAHWPLNEPVPLASIDFDDAQCRADAKTRGGL